MSMQNVSKYYRLTMDTDKQNGIYLHRKDGSNILFSPSEKGLYYYALGEDETFESVWSLINTVSEQAEKYTRRQYQAAQRACKMQNIIMRMSDREMMDSAIRHLQGCPVTRADVQAATDILGPNLGALKGKTVHRANQHVQSGVDGVPPEVLDLHQNVTLCVDIMFINKIPFFMTYSQNIRFGTVEALPNRQMPTIVRRLKSVARIYEQRGLKISSILADPEFEPLRRYFPQLNTCGKNEHVPDIERYIRTVKD